MAMELFSLLFISGLHALGCNFNIVNCKLICPFEQMARLIPPVLGRRGFATFFPLPSRHNARKEGFCNLLSAALTAQCKEGSL